MRSPKSEALLSRYSTIIIFLIPALTIFTLFVVLPIGEAAYYSFYRWNGYGAPEKYVGFKNYAYLFKNRVFIMSLKNNFYIIALWSVGFGVSCKNSQPEILINSVASFGREPPNW